MFHFSPFPLSSKFLFLLFSLLVRFFGFPSAFSFLSSSILNKTTRNHGISEDLKEKLAINYPYISIKKERGRCHALCTSCFSVRFFPSGLCMGIFPVWFFSSGFSSLIFHSFFSLFFFPSIFCLFFSIRSNLIMAVISVFV